MSAENLLILGLGLGVFAALLLFACLLPSLRWAWLVEDEPADGWVAETMADIRGLPERVYDQEKDPA